MRMLLRKYNAIFWIIVLASLLVAPVYADTSAQEGTSIDRIQLVTQQIRLLKGRLDQEKHEVEVLQTLRDRPVSQLLIQKASKKLVDKAALDMTVTKSNLESIDIELADSQQTVNWLEKGVQEIENQLNVLGVFGMKIARYEIANIQNLRTNLAYQKELLELEKNRVKYLQHLQTTAKQSLSLKQENSNRINTLLKSHNILHLKQQQMKEELSWQEQQTHWLQQLNQLNTKLRVVDPAKDRIAYTAIEREIFYANEKASYAYLQSLIARYTDQIEQMKLALRKGSSITILNEISDRVQALIKQTNRLSDTFVSRDEILEKHIGFLSPKVQAAGTLKEYVRKLTVLKRQFRNSEKKLSTLKEKITEFRQQTDLELQKELSSRQGFPNLGIKFLLDIGKETLLVPALAFQEFKSLSYNLLKGINVTTTIGWTMLALIQALFLSAIIYLRHLLTSWSLRPSQWRMQVNAKWLSLQCMRRNLLDVFVISNLIGTLFFFGVPLKYFMFIVNISMVWLVFKTIITIARICLAEATHDTSGHDVRLYRRLKWLILAGLIITAITVFVHQLPLVYEIKAVCDWLFLSLLMIVSIMLLRSSQVVPHLIISHMETSHPYFEKSIRLFGVLIPALMFCNAFVGLIGYVNLIMTISRYEGIFLLVLIGYLILRGFLSDGMEQLSRLMIKYVSNGWLWTEAFLKPLDTIFRIALFLSAGAMLFLLYGWDKQSPIVERLTRLLHYELTHVLNTSITPLSMIELAVVISIFYWTAKWTREFMYRMLAGSTNDMGIRNSIAILSQYFVVAVGVFICMRVLGIDLTALTAVAAALAFGIGFGLRDLASNFVCGFLILLERPLRVGDIVSVNNIEGEVLNIGSRAVTIRTWDHMDLLVPNNEIFNKSFTNLTAKDNVVRSIIAIQIRRHDNPHEVRGIIQNVLATHDEVLKDPAPEVYLREMSDTRMSFELRYFVNLRQIKSRTGVISAMLMRIWDEFNRYGIKPPYPQHDVFLHGSQEQALLLEPGVEKSN